MIGTVSKQMVAGLLIFAFVGIVLISLQFMNITNKEAFISKPVTATRSANCQCFPGYVPAKNTVRNTYFCQNLTNPSKIRKCY